MVFDADVIGQWMGWGVPWSLMQGGTMVFDVDVKGQWLRWGTMAFDAVVIGEWGDPDQKIDSLWYTDNKVNTLPTELNLACNTNQNRVMCHQ